MEPRVVPLLCLWGRIWQIEFLDSRLTFVCTRQRRALRQRHPATAGSAMAVAGAGSTAAVTGNDGNGVLGNGGSGKNRLGSGNGGDTTAAQAWWQR
jgi:hypothetical protein